jgi:hypothetical protein
MSLLDGSRSFRLWEYRVSHGSLLLRSPKNERFATNIDVVFVGVECVRMSTQLSGLRVVESMAAHFEEELADSGPLSGEVFSLLCSAGSGLVVAAACKVSEHDEDFLWSPFD